MRLRLWLSVDKAAAESYELLLRGSTRVSLFLNGYKLGSKEAPRRDSWFAYRLSADLLHDGANLLALSFASDNGHGPCSDSPIAVLLRRVGALAAADLRVAVHRHLLAAHRRLPGRRPSSTATHCPSGAAPWRTVASSSLWSCCPRPSSI